MILKIPECILLEANLFYFYFTPSEFNSHWASPSMTILPCAMVFPDAAGRYVRTVLLSNLLLAVLLFACSPRNNKEVQMYIQLYVHIPVSADQ